MRTGRLSRVRAPQRADNNTERTKARPLPATGLSFDLLMQ